MKNRNQREMEKHWAQEAQRKSKPAKKKALSREDRNQAALRKTQQPEPTQE